MNCISVTVRHDEVDVQIVEDGPFPIRPARDGEGPPDPPPTAPPLGMAVDPPEYSDAPVGLRRAA